MNLNEVQRLIEQVQAWCPVQSFTESTNDIWAEELGPFAAEPVRRAARELMSAPRDVTDRPRYLHLGDLIARAKVIARQSTAKLELPEPPPKAATPEAREEWSADRARARSTGNVEAFLRKWYGVGSLTAITKGKE